MELSKLNHFKLLENIELADLNLASKEQLVNAAELERWFSVIGNTLITYHSDSTEKSKKIASKQISVAIEAFNKMQNINNNTIELHLTTNNRFRNILELIADDFSLYVTSKPNFNKRVKDLAKYGRLITQAMTSEISLFKKYFDKR
jgi:hypothetical protein